MILKQEGRTSKTLMAQGIMSKPVVLVFAGPNGSGKSTITVQMTCYGVYVNADDLKKEYSLTDLEAAQQAEALRNKLVEIKADFTFETVLSTERNLKLLQKAKENGYNVQCIYDNSVMPSLIFIKDEDTIQFFPNSIWPIEKLKGLLNL